MPRAVELNQSLRKDAMAVLDKTAGRYVWNSNQPLSNIYRSTPECAQDANLLNIRNLRCRSCNPK